ncbi:MAG: hypothetical protein MI757_17445 [Pirellulales bacterium]|nr:hypothetical protein [Pirellulales bacterium]
MTTKLPTELQELVKQKPTKVRLEDDQTNDVYVVIDEETHRKAMRALQEKEDHEAIAEGIRQMERGEGRPLSEVDADMRKKLNLPPRQ